MTKRIRIIVSGRVQGVCYRASTQEMALNLGLAGWVRNCHNGNVEAVFEGVPEKVDMAIDWCRTGPPSASVRNIEIHKDNGEDIFTSFKIRY